MLVHHSVEAKRVSTLIFLWPIISRLKHKGVITTVKYKWNDMFLLSLLNSNYFMCRLWLRERNHRHQTHLARRDKRGRDRANNSRFRSRLRTTVQAGLNRETFTHWIGTLEDQDMCVWMVISHQIGSESLSDPVTTEWDQTHTYIKDILSSF